MQNTRILTTPSPKLFHVQTNTSLDLPSNLEIIHIGKPNDNIPPNIDVSTLPSSDVVSRVHANIIVEGNNYFVEDAGSSNGTYLNNIRLVPKTRYHLNLGDRIDLGQENQVSFIFQLAQSASNPSGNPGVILSQVGANQPDNFSKLVGLGLMILGVFILGTTSFVGIIFYSPLGIILSTAGAITLVFGKQYRNWGWVVLALGVALIIGSARVMGSMSLFSLIASFACLAIGYQLFSTGQVAGYRLPSTSKK